MINKIIYRPIKEIKQILVSRNTITESGNGLIPAAVMIVIKYFKDCNYILFIKRSDVEWDPFSGHMAFPGGKNEKEDKDLLETAYRETLEETGIDLKINGQLLGRLDDCKPNNPMARNIVVTPYISYLDKKVSIIPNYEVDEALWIPISHLKDESNLEILYKSRDGKIIEDYNYRFNDYVIWGMTGRVLHQFLELFSELLD